MKQCMLITAVGNWYNAELELLGIDPDALVAPGDDSYEEVRRLGLAADLRVQEAMVTIAEAKRQTAVEMKAKVSGDAALVRPRPPLPP